MMMKQDGFSTRSCILNARRNQETKRLMKQARGYVHGTWHRIYDGCIYSTYWARRKAV